MKKFSSKIKSVINFIKGVRYVKYYYVPQHKDDTWLGSVKINKGDVLVIGEDGKVTTLPKDYVSKVQDNDYKNKYPHYFK